MKREEFERVFAAAAEKSGVAELARKNQFAENLEAMMCKLRDKLNSLPDEKPGEDLEKFIQDLIDKYPVNKESVPNDSLNDYYQGLRFGVLQGVQWQKEQMMSAVDATCVLLPPPDVFKVLICHEVTDKLADKQKIKILIVKEDEQ